MTSDSSIDRIDGPDLGSGLRELSFELENPAWLDVVIVLTLSPRNYVRNPTPGSPWPTRAHSAHPPMGHARDSNGHVRVDIKAAGER